MMRPSEFLRQHILSLLASNRLAFLLALVFALLPYTMCLSLAVLALVTLKKGWRDGALLMMPVATACFGLSLSHATPMAATINTVLTFVPCYLGACVLGMTASWRAVSGFFLGLLFLSSVLLQCFLPEFITAQLVYLKTITEANPDIFANLLSKMSGFNQSILANYLFGLQVLGMIFAAMVPIMLARLVQANLVYPGGFRQEMLNFRGDKLGLFILVGVLVLANQGQAIAINLLPSLVVYFILLGMSLSAYAFTIKKTRGAFLFLMTPLLLLPVMMIVVYVILGSLDTLFNLRVFLLSKVAGKTT